MNENYNQFAIYDLRELYNMLKFYQQAPKENKQASALVTEIILEIQRKQSATN